MNTSEGLNQITKCKSCKLAVSPGNAIGCGSCGEKIHMGCTEYNYDRQTIDRMNRPHSEVYYMCTDCRYYFRNSGQRMIAISRRMNRIATRHRMALNMLTASMFPVLDLITEINPMLTGVTQIDEAMMKISNAVRPVMAAIAKVNNKHIAILEEIADMNSENETGYISGIKRALEQLNETNTYIEMITLAGIEEGLQPDEIDDHYEHIQNELKRLMFGIKYTLDRMLTNNADSIDWNEPN